MEEEGVLYDVSCSYVRFCRLRKSHHRHGADRRETSRLRNIRILQRSLWYATDSGFWTSRGFGFVEYDGEEFDNSVSTNSTARNCTVYQETNISCLVDTSFFYWYLIRKGPFYYPPDDNGNVVSIDMDQQVNMTFDRSTNETFLRNCSSLGNGVITPTVGEIGYVADALRTFDYQTFAERYGFFDIRGVDWDAVTSQARSTLLNNSTDEQLFDVLCSCIQPL